MSYLYIAVESENMETVVNDLRTIGGLKEHNLIIVKANQEKRKFRQFNMIADLYIWITKYWHGTYYEKLVFIRIKNSKNVPILFSLKYGEKIRLVIKSQIASILKKEDEKLLVMTYKKSMHEFNKARISEINSGMRLLQGKWELLVSNGNPYPQKLI